MDQAKNQQAGLKKTESGQEGQTGSTNRGTCTSLKYVHMYACKLYYIPGTKMVHGFNY